MGGKPGRSGTATSPEGKKSRSAKLKGNRNAAKKGTDTVNGRAERHRVLLEIIGQSGRDDIGYLQEALRERGHTVVQETVYKDRQAIRAMTDKWTAGLIRTAWMAKVMRMYQDMGAECAKLQDMIKMAEEDAEAKLQEVEPIAAALEESGREEEAETIRTHARIATLATTVKSVTALDARLQEKRNNLINMATDIPMYDELRRRAYADPPAETTPERAAAHVVDR